MARCSADVRVQCSACGGWADASNDVRALSAGRRLGAAERAVSAPCPAVVAGRPVPPAVAQAHSNSGRIQADLIGPRDRWLEWLPISNGTGSTESSWSLHVGRRARSTRRRASRAPTSTPASGNQCTGLATSASTSPSTPTSSSICARSMISGGESAMVSPVTRMSTPRSKQRANASNACLPGASA